MKILGNLKWALLAAMVLGFTTSAYAGDKSYDCYGTYDHYDDTCYYDSGDYTHYKYRSGHRRVFRNGRRYGHHRYNNGRYGGWYPRGGYRGGHHRPYYRRRNNHRGHHRPYYRRGNHHRTNYNYGDYDRPYDHNGRGSRGGNNHRRRRNH